MHPGFLSFYALCSLFGQLTTFPVQAVDISADAPKSVRTGIIPAKLATCVAGPPYLAAEATARGMINDCTATNIWTLSGGPSAIGAAPRALDAILDKPRLANADPNDPSGVSDDHPPAGFVGIRAPVTALYSTLFPQAAPTGPPPASGGVNPNTKLNVQAFGAKGDGVSDDRTAIQAAFTAAGAQGGGIVFFPAPGTYSICSAPVTKFLVTVPDKVSAEGPGKIKICDSIGNWRVLFHIPTSHNAIFQNLTVDENAMSDAANTTPIAANEHIFIMTNHGSDLTVKNITFLNGNDLQTLSLNDCNNCTVTGNHWSNMGIGSTIDHDSSAVYIIGNNGVVSNNTFAGSGIGVRTAIEVHGDGQKVIGNSIKQYKICVITFVGVGTMRNLNISDNICSNVYLGISMWAQGGNYDGTIISGNQIAINRHGPWPPALDSSGVASYPANTNGFMNLSIVTNKITYVPDAFGTNNLSAGISFSNQKEQAALSNISVRNNTITNSLCGGVLFQSGGSAVTNLDISSNVITNPGTSSGNGHSCAPEYRSGIALIGNKAWVSSTVKNNIIIDNQSTPTMQWGEYFHGVSGDNASSGLTIENDKITFAAPPKSRGGVSPYVFFLVTSPKFHLIVPGFDRSTPIANGAGGEFPPIGSSIYDPKNGRTYTQSADGRNSF